MNYLKLSFPWFMLGVWLMTLTVYPSQTQWSTEMAKKDQKKSTATPSPTRTPIFTAPPAISPTVTIEILLNSTQQFATEGKIDGQGLLNSLTTKLEGAIAARDRGQAPVACNKIKAFSNEVAAQRGKKIAESAAVVLLQLATNIDLCQVPSPTFTPTLTLTTTSTPTPTLTPTLPVTVTLTPSPTKTITPTFTPVPNPLRCKQLTMGYQHLCQLQPNGTIMCWGDNTFGQTAPISGTFTQVSAGGHHTCGLKADQTVVCWGDNTFGQTKPQTNTFTQISAGTWHTCGLKPNGQVACWGQNTHQQAASPKTKFTAISAGTWHTCGLKPNGQVLCWGDNEFGQTRPKVGPFTQISVGGRHSCGLKPTGEVACWGLNTYGQATPPAAKFVQLRAGERHTCGLKVEGTIVCWGLNIDGQTNSPEGSFNSVSAGSNQTCGIKADCSVVCWGNTTATCLLSDEPTLSPSPVAYPFPSEIPYPNPAYPLPPSATTNLISPIPLPSLSPTPVPARKAPVPSAQVLNISRQGLPFIVAEGRYRSPTPTPTQTADSRKFAHLGIHLGSLPSRDWDAESLHRLVGTNAPAVWPAVVVLFSDQVFDVQRRPASDPGSKCEITGVKVNLAKDGTGRGNILNFLTSYSQVKDAKIIFRLPSPGNFDDAVDARPHRLITEPDKTPFRSDGKTRRTYCLGEGVNNGWGYLSFRAIDDLLAEMDQIIGYLNTIPNFITSTVAFLPANEPNGEWYSKWENPQLASVLESTPPWEDMNAYFTQLYQLKLTKGSRAKILTPPMGQGNFAEAWTAECKPVDFKLLGTPTTGGYGLMLTGLMTPTNNDGYTWNNYWNPGRENWTDADGKTGCEEPLPKLSRTDHVFQLFPSALKQFVRQKDKLAIITEADLLSYGPKGVGQNGNIVGAKSENILTVINSLPKFAIAETEGVDKGAKDIALWMLVQDHLSYESQSITSCLQLRYDNPLFAKEGIKFQETLWHEAYLANGTECPWFGDIWKRPAPGATGQPAIIRP